MSEQRDLTMYVGKSGHYVDLTFKEDGIDVTASVVEVRMYLKDGLVYGYDMCLEDGTWWGGNTIPIEDMGHVKIVPKK
jgi:hypothetical protein